MSALITEPNLADFDAVYQRWIDAHSGLPDLASQRLNARLVLILFNHLGDETLIGDALSLAVSTAESEQA